MFASVFLLYRILCFGSLECFSIFIKVCLFVCLFEYCLQFGSAGRETVEVKDRSIDINDRLMDVYFNSSVRDAMNQKSLFVFSYIFHKMSA